MRKTVGKTIFLDQVQKERKTGAQNQIKGKLDLSTKTDIQVEMPSRQLSIIKPGGRHRDPGHKCSLWIFQNINDI